MEDKINDWRTKSTTKAKRRVHARTTDTWYLVLRLLIIPGGTLCGFKKSTGLRSAGGARARKNVTETYVKGAGRRGPRFFGANIDLIMSLCQEVLVQS